MTLYAVSKYQRDGLFPTSPGYRSRVIPGQALVGSIVPLLSDAFMAEYERSAVAKEIPF
jgi:hypothetical protein